MLNHHRGFKLCSATSEADFSASEGVLLSL